MRIAIDALGIHYYGGGRSSILNLLNAVFNNDKEDEFLVIVTQHEPELASPHGNVKQWVIPIKNRFLVRLYAQCTFPFKLRQYDLVHFIKNLSVFLFGIPSIITIHDLTTLRYPDLNPKFDYWYWKLILPVMVRKARIITTVSKNAAKDIIKYFNIPKEKIRVIYNSYASIYEPMPPSVIKRIKRKYQISGAYILSVGRIDPKKNLSLLVEAFAKLVKENKYTGKLVLVGEVYRKNPDLRLRSTIEKHHLEQRIIFTGPVPDSDLVSIYSGATVVVITSLHEGFGITALEAMACGVPLVTTPAGAIREVVSDGALIVENPTPHNLQQSILAVIQSPKMRNGFIRKGYNRSREFSWKKSAIKMISIYKELSTARPAQHVE